MTNQEILEGAPEGATHIYVDKIVKPLLADADAYVSSYLGFGKWSDNDVNTQSLDFSSVRSLADIERIAELDKKVTNLTKLVKSKKKEIYFLKATGGDV